MPLWKEKPYFLQSTWLFCTKSNPCMTFWNWGPNSAAFSINLTMVICCWRATQVLSDAALSNCWLNQSKHEIIKKCRVPYNTDRTWSVEHGCFLLLGPALKARLLFPVGGLLNYLCFQVCHATNCGVWAPSNNPGVVSSPYIQTCFRLSCVPPR